MPVTNTPTNTTALTVTEKPTLTTTQRTDLVNLFTESGPLKVRRVKGLLRYHGITHDQLIAAMHDSADRDGVPLVIEEKTRSTMKRSMAVVKAWYAAKAHELVTSEDSNRDAVFEYLSQIADITGAALEKYLVPEEERTDSAVPEWDEVVIPAGHYGEGQPELAIDVNHGTGLLALGPIVEEYMVHRTRDDSGDVAAEWLRLYRLAVVYANNERRRKGQEHDTLAAGARVGSKDKTPRGARNQGGTGSKKTEGAATPAPAAGVPDHRQPGEKPSRDLTVRELLAAIHMRVIDPATVITTGDAKEYDSLHQAWEKRLMIEAAGGTYTAPVPVPVVKPMVSTDQAQADRQNAINRAPAPVNQDALIRAVLAELAAAGISPSAPFVMPANVTPILATAG